MGALAYRDWLLPSLQARLLFCLRSGIVTGLCSIWLLNPTTRELLQGGILVPVLAIVVVNETIAETIAFAVAGFIGKHTLCDMCLQFGVDVWCVYFCVEASVIGF